MPEATSVIKIVPLHRPPEARAPRPAIAGPQFTYRDGPLIAAVKVFAVFWGSAWSQSDNQTTATQLNDFFGYLVTSPLLGQLSEYNVSNYSIGSGSFAGALTASTPDPGSTTTDADIRQFLQQLISSGQVPTADNNSLYFIFLPPGVTVQSNGDSSCQAFCGYHDAINSEIFYAVMPYPGCSGCLGGLTAFNALTGTSSHEFCEAITDPIPGQGWYDDSNGEIGDVCAWQFKQLGNYTVQLEWSNKAGKCI